MTHATLSDSFRSALAAVDTAAGGLGNAVADMLALGACEYLTFDQFREAVKSGLSVAAWATVTNYMAPIKRAWESGKVAEFCQAARETGIKSALKMFPAGTGKRGAPAKPEPEAEAPAIVAILPTSAEAEATAKADALIAEAEAAMALDNLKAENAALLAMVESLKAQNAALMAENATLKAKGNKAKPVKVAATA